LNWVFGWSSAWPITGYDRLGVESFTTLGTHAQQNHTFDLFTISRCTEQRVLATQGRGCTVNRLNTIGGRS
jgi:hypothetical protein